MAIGPLYPRHTVPTVGPHAGAGCRPDGDEGGADLLVSRTTSPCLGGGVQVSVLIGRRERQAGVDGSIPHVDPRGSQYVKSHDLPLLVVPEI
ncbi:hypothetical protein GCM10012278_91580 [Nonomuraea glycinis]|uniref:Uncharacterized protein n=1 Tax=Nonomuraea glycinis TaxID=2047744 RepID=A0A918AEX8_9ACTN|nr:hypothetical protein GCM10012278_91580 [Nonomuraea glycinis]